MKIYFCIAAIFSLTACTSAPSKLINDQLGIVSLSLPAGYIDETKTYLDDASRHRIRLTSGVKHLVKYGRENSDDFCEVRELTYSRGEEGFEWDSRRLAMEVAKTENNAIVAASISQLLNAGMKSLSVKPEYSNKLLSETGFNAASISGHQITFNRLAKYPDGSEAIERQGKTIAINISPSLSSEKRYIVFMCEVYGGSQEKHMTELSNVAASLQLLPPHTDVANAAGESAFMANSSPEKIARAGDVAICKIGQTKEAAAKSRPRPTLQALNDFVGDADELNVEFDGSGADAIRCMIALSDRPQVLEQNRKSPTKIGIPIIFNWRNTIFMKYKQSTNPFGANADFRIVWVPVIPNKEQQHDLPDFLRKAAFSIGESIGIDIGKMSDLGMRITVGYFDKWVTLKYRALDSGSAIAEVVDGMGRVN